MSAFLIASVYIVGLAIPAALLYLYRDLSWYWHVLAISLALGLGLMPSPAGWDTPGMSLVFGFVFTALMIWGLGGLVLYRPSHHHHRQKHA